MGDKTQTDIMIRRFPLIHEKGEKLWQKREFHCTSLKRQKACFFVHSSFH